MKQEGWERQEGLDRREAWEERDRINGKHVFDMKGGNGRRRGEEERMGDTGMIELT